MKYPTRCVALKQLLNLSLVVLLSACASPGPMVFAPAKVNSLATIYAGQPFSVQINDVRQSNHLLKVIDSDGTKRRYPAYNPIHLQLEDNLKSGLSIQGINITPGSDKITLSVHHLEAIIEQSSLEYNAAFIVEFKLTISKGRRTFSKIFTGNATNTGHFGYDKARMEQELNQLVTAVFNTIYADPQVRQVIEV
ncbi:MAG: putative lipoprotein [Alteromonadaceae bacterium]|jgi:uncharacterized lipoprotein